MSRVLILQGSPRREVAFPVGEGDLRRGITPAGAFPYLPLGEGAAAAAEEGWYQVGSAYRPTPVRASPCHPLPGEGLGGLRRGRAGGQLT